LPASGSIIVGGEFLVYAQILETNITEAAGVGANVNCWIGYSTGNTDPSTWSDWIPAAFNTQVGDNDEFIKDIGSGLSTGTYYYATKFRVDPNNEVYSYGGYNSGGGGFWDGSTNISGTLTVSTNYPDWCNLQWPENGTIDAGGSIDVYAQIFESGVTEAVGAATNVSCWIGINSADTDPSTWTNWITATFSSQQSNNDEFTAAIGSGLTAGTYYYASRFKVNPNADEYSYGGYNADVWDGTTNVNGILTINIPAGACSSDLIISEYSEGSFNNRYIEIYNGTGASIDLSNYILKQSHDGEGWVSDVNSIYNKPLSGTLANEDVFVIASDDADASVTSEADLQITYSDLVQGGKIVSFTGNDAIGLFKSTNLIDVFGDPSSSSTIQVAGSAMGSNHTMARKNSIFDGNTNWSNSSGTDAASSEWIVYSEDTWSYLGSHDMDCSPKITLSETTLTGFTYIYDDGPSAEQSFTVIGTNLTANISIAAPTNYDISTTTGGAFSATDPIVLTQSGGDVSETTIYVRLAAGLTADDYNSENITATSTDADDKIVTCSGTVITPTLSASETALTGFEYYFGAGPSASQTFTVSGTNLTANLVITAPTNYEVSDDDASFGASVSLTPVSNTVAVTTIYVKLKSGLAIGEYNLEDITISSTNATSETVSCSGDVVLAPATDLTVVCTTNTTAVVTWSAPVGTSDGVVIAFRDDDDNPPHTISDGTDPSTINANSTFMSGTEFGSTTLHSFVVYKGTGTSVTVTGLTTGETYKVKAYTYSSSNWILNDDCPTVTVSNLSLPEVTAANHTDSDSQSELNWNNPSLSCVDEIMVVCKHGSSVSTSPSGDGSSYTANPIFISGTDIGSSEYVAFKGTGTTVTITGLTNDETYYAKIFTKNGTEWSTGVELVLYPATVTILEYGDLAIVAVNTNQSNGDEISFVSFKSISSGTTIDFTDNGYERENTDQWGDTEGTIRITRTGSAIPAGTVITIVGEDGSTSPAWVTDFNIYIDGSNDNANWNLSSLNGLYSFNMNSTDQIWILQGGNWSNGTGSQDATYSGNVLYGWTAIAWKTSPNYASTSGSTIYPGCECATTNVLGKTYVDKVKYTGSITAANRTEWIGRINDPDNWTDYADNSAYDSGSPEYRDNGATFTINAGDLTSGKWAGYKSSEWCDCANWYSLKVPNTNIDVEIPVVSSPQFELVLEDDTDCTAECNSLDILGTVSNSEGAILKVYSDFELNTGSVDFSTNTIDIEIGGDIIIDDATNFLTSKADLTMNGTGSQSFNIEGATLKTIELNSLNLTSGGTKTIADNLDIETDLVADNSIINFSTSGSSLNIDGDITLQNGATMHDNCKSNLDIILTTGTTQIIKGSGNPIKALSITADKTDANLTLSSTGGTSDLYIGTLGDFNMTGTSIFTDNASIIQTDDDLYLGGDDSDNYSLTGTVKFTGNNVTGDMILSDDDGSSTIAAKLYNLNVTSGNLEVYPTTGAQTIIVNNDFDIEGTSTIDANSNDFEIGGDYYVNADDAFDASGITITLNGTSDQDIDANSDQETFGNLIVNKTSGNVNLSDNIEADDLDLTSGLVNTGTYRVYVSNTTTTNLSNYSTTSYINGNLRREVATSGSYDLPVGNTTNYELANININSSTGLNYLDASFHPAPAELDISTLGLSQAGVAVEEILDAGFWTISPDAGMSAISYNVGLNLSGATNAGALAEQHTVIKRENSSLDWTLSGHHDNSTQEINSGVVYAYRDHISSMSDYAIAKNKTNILPIELVSFTLKCNDYSTQLTWITASEINNDYFEVQRSLDALLWEKISKIDGAGNSNKMLSYRFTDEKHNKRTYYRLKQVDFDGKFEYSEILANECYNNQTEAIEIYPNPTNDFVNIKIENWDSGTLKLEIFDMMGRLVLSKELFVNNGTTNDRIDISKFNPGVYHIRFSDKNTTINLKIIKK
jgi:hypothetical protein